MNGVATAPFISDPLAGDLSITFTGQPVGSYIWIDDISPWGAIPLNGPYQMDHKSTVQSVVDAGIIVENVLDTGNGLQITSDIPTGDAITHTVTEEIVPIYKTVFDEYDLSNQPFSQLGGIVMCPCILGGAHIILSNDIDLLTPYD